MPLNNPVAVPVFVELVGGEKITRAATAWTDWDLSAIVPAGTLAVLVALETNAGAGNRGCRKNGSALNRWVTQDAASEGQWTMVCEVDDNRIIEVYPNHAVGDNFSILGYWK